MYFHVSAQRYMVGSIIQPGMWGAATRQFTYANPPPDINTVTTLFYEIALEAVRAAKSPESPSRLNCVYASETLDIARSFRDRYRGGKGSIYSVVPADPDHKVYRGDFALISTPKNGAPPYVDYMVEEALQYWTNEAEMQPELLFSCAMRVVARVE